MRREPSIHITKSQLIGILSKLVSKGVNSADMAKNMMHMAKAHSISTRTITVTNDRLEKKVKKMVQSSRLDADIFARLIYVRRKYMKHRGISQIKPSSKEWGLLKEITSQALAFVEEFDLNKKEGFTDYINIGLTKMKRFGLNRFVNLYESICSTYQSKREIILDDNPELTREMYTYFQRYIINETGVVDKLEDVPDKYVWFVRATKQALDMGVSVTIYIGAQFAGLSFARGIPHPSQLVGDGAHERVVRYIYKKGINIGTKEPKKNWLDMNKIFSNENTSD